MSAPKRIQMSRQHPWRADNPDAVIVARPSKWGNPYYAIRCFDPTIWAVGSDLNGDAVGQRWDSRAEAVVAAVARFAKYANGRVKKEPDWLSALAGRDLACWCKPGDPCHADVLLKLANGDDRG